MRAFGTFSDSDGLVSAAGERLIDVVDAAIAARGRALVHVKTDLWWRV